MREEKVDKRKIVSADRLEHMKMMREALARKNQEKKEAKKDPPKKDPVPVPEVIETIEEEVEEEVIETPVPPKKRVVPKANSYSFEEDIRRYVEDALPPELRRESRKEKKWELRKEQLKAEILQSLQPTPPPVVSEAPVQNNKNATFELKDLFW